MYVSTQIPNQSPILVSNQINLSDCYHFYTNMSPWHRRLLSTPPLCKPCANWPSEKLAEKLTNQRTVYVAADSNQDGDGRKTILYRNSNNRTNFFDLRLGLDFDLGFELKHAQVYTSSCTWVSFNCLTTCLNASFGWMYGVTVVYCRPVKGDQTPGAW